MSLGVLSHGVLKFKNSTQHGPHVPYPHHLRTLQKDMDVNWVHEEMEGAQRNEDMHLTSQE